LVGEINKADFYFSLTWAAALTLIRKIQRDGILLFAKTIYRICTEEWPVEAIAGHREVVALFEHQSLEPLRPQSLANKYLSGYMAKKFGKRERRRILLHHYRRIIDQTSLDFHSRITAGPCILWRQFEVDDTFAIALSFNERSHYEGDLSLVFLCGEQRIFEISFAIVPGSIVGPAHDELLLIGRVQGVKDQFDAIKRATGACRDVAPQHMLILAVQSIAQTLGIQAIAGVRRDEQLANLPTMYFEFDYDAFWEALLASKTVRDFYEIPIPPPKKPLADIQASHRRRTRRKREFKESVACHIARTSAEALWGPNPSGEVRVKRSSTRCAPMRLRLSSGTGQSVRFPRSKPIDRQPRRRDAGSAPLPKADDIP
jgi:uncharacterized protein